MIIIVWVSSSHQSIIVIVMGHIIIIYLFFFGAFRLGVAVVGFPPIEVALLDGGALDVNFFLIPLSTMLITPTYLPTHTRYLFL